MVKKQKKKTSLEAADTDNLQEFKNSLSSILKEALTSWVTVEDGYKNILSWVGLSRDDVAVAVHSKEKDAKNETSPLGFYKTMLHRIAQMLKNNTQFNKKQIIEKCLECHDYIQSIIKDFVDANETFSNNGIRKPTQTSEVCSEDPATSNKKKRKSELVPGKSSKKKSKSEDGEASKSNQNPIPEEQEIQFMESISDEEEKQFMDSLPDEIKVDFRELGFSKWGKDWLPVLILSPYDVDVNLRDQWKKKYEKFKKKKGPFEHIFFWYGAKNASEYFGFARKSELKLYAEAKKQDLHMTPKRLEAKEANNKKLSAPEKNIIDGFREIGQAVALSKVERWQRSDADQAAAESNDEEMTQDETEESNEDIEVSQPTLKTQTRERKKKLPLNTKDEMRGGETQELSEKIDVSQQIHKKMKSRSKKKQEISEEIASSSGSTTSVDEEFEVEPSEKEYPEQKRSQGRKAPKKEKGPLSSKESTSKSKIEEVPPSEDYAVLEKKEFLLNEKNILPIMRKLELSVSKKNSVEAYAKMQDLKKILHTITPSFIEIHPIGKLLKNTRQAFENQQNIVDTARAISGSMKEIYNEKIKNRQDGIQEVKETKQIYNSGREEVKSEAGDTEYIPETSKELLLTSPTTEPMDLQTLLPATDIIPRKGGSSKTETQSSVVPQQVADTKAPVLTKPKKPKFSLGAMIDGSKQALASSIAKECVSYLAVPNVLATYKKGPPGWLTDALPDNITDPTIGDEVRSLGKEFIEAIDADWPDDVLEQINIASFVYHIEKAIFEWSQEDLTAKPRTSTRAPIKPLLKYPENYWVKVRDVVAGLSGDRLFNKPKLVEWMLRGDYETPMDLIKLPGITFYQSMKNLL